MIYSIYYVWQRQDTGTGRGMTLVCYLTLTDEQESSFTGVIVTAGSSMRENINVLPGCLVGETGMCLSFAKQGLEVPMEALHLKPLQT